MKFEELKNILHNDSLVIAKKWAKGVVVSEYTKTYSKFPEEDLVKIGKRVYDNLGQWLEPTFPPTEIGKIYAKIGAERYDQGFPLCEITYAIHIIKKALLNHIFSAGILPDTLNLYRTHDIVAKVHDFFDLASFYLTRGYQEALYKKILTQKGIDQGKIKKLFPDGSFFYEKEPHFRTFEKAMEGFNIFKLK
jgi:hypothetical protein